MNQLRHLAEFKEVLAHYNMSEAAKNVLAQTRLVLLVAPTATGRNTIIRELIKTGQYRFIVSDTTRQPRINDGIPEQNGREYWFRSEEEVLEDLKAGKFLEAAIIHNQQVSGLSIRELELAGKKGKIATTDIEVVGVSNIMRAKPDTVAIFVLPPSFEAWMHRMDSRGDMDKDEKRRRLESAVKELTAALEVDYYKFVVNDTVPGAISQINRIAIDGKIDDNLQKSGMRLVNNLLIKTKDFIDKPDS